MDFKGIVLFLHRWLGLITGLVVLILSITGCLYVFHQEISDWVRHDTFFADQVPETQQHLPIEELQSKAADALGVEQLSYGITTYKNPQKNWSAMYYEAGADSWFYFGSMKSYKTAYINPYNGKIEGIVNEKTDFFQIIKGIHWSLLLATPIGQPIVVWSTVVFIILLISGMILWWPKKWNKAGKQKSFKIKWGSTWRRVNYDLHNVLGFYFLMLSLIIAFTGLYWYFPFAKKSMHFLGTGEYALPAGPGEKVVSTIPDTKTTDNPMDKAYNNAWNQYPKANSIALVAPADSQATISATVRPDGETYYGRSYLEFDQYTGELLAADRYKDKNAGEKLVAMNYDIHIGAIGGLPGKIIAFFASLICASLPVTGFIIWWDRKKRQWAREERLAKRRKKSDAPKERIPA
ncbi:PepSY-associated TM helix domain-containing protein [Fodinibius sp. Rm-B-1B1-1]|uniref:PepSY-associated TM helix domain-containing protein n=1 Tax=Fodinibius alkaliphilus TaxID=3140241 RepID=UPI00315AC1D1